MLAVQASARGGTELHFWPRPRCHTGHNEAFFKGATGKGVLRDGGSHSLRRDSETPIATRKGNRKPKGRCLKDDVQMLADPELGKTNKAKMCQLTYELYKTILGLPERESGPLLRFMFASEK
jgi:hypothetical protein